MKIWVFSIGEPTTQLCCDLLAEYGFEVILLQDETLLWQKLKRFYTEALDTKDQSFMRIDADIIPYSNCTELKGSSWVCASGFDWYKQGLGAISIHLMDRQVVEKCLEYVDKAEGKNRPESYLWRLVAINHYTSIDNSQVFGLHGYGQKTHRDRIKQLKASRNQAYNWDLVERIENI